MAPEADHPPTLLTGLVPSARCGWWQSAHAVWRFRTPPNSFSSADW